MNKPFAAASAALALALAAATPARSAAPVCGDVNDTSSITSTDALLVLKKSVLQPVTLDCSAFDDRFSQCENALDACESGAVCGNGTIEAGEDCEEGNFAVKSCKSLGFAGGKLACAVGCTFDTSGCYETRYVETDETIVDLETGLEWEKKTAGDGAPNYDDIHDADNAYSWCVPGMSYPDCLNTNNPFDGAAATTFLARLNGNADDICYAGHCDWRLPTIDELETIFTPDPDCGTPPCPADDVFLPMSANAYWSSTSETPYSTYYAWGVIPDTGLRGGYYKRSQLRLRAVRQPD